MNIANRQKLLGIVAIVAVRRARETYRERL